MNCDNCDTQVNFGQREYMDRKEHLGTVLCYECRNSVGRDSIESEPMF